MTLSLRGGWHWAIPIAVGLGLLFPLLFSDRTFASDWGNHLWLIWLQGRSIEALQEPSYFLQTALGFFYPYYAFYGGTFYAGLGVVSLLSNPEAAVIVAYIGAFAATYVGWTWIARQAGLEGWWAQLPGCVAVTAPYAVTNLYGRGDIPEMVATSMLPLIAASALSLVREPRVRLRSCAAYVVGVAVLTGTHTLTLIWGTTFLGLCALVILAANWEAARAGVRRGPRLLWLSLLGVGINAWILVPLFLYHSRLRERGPDALAMTDVTSPAHLFALFRTAAGLHPEVTADLNAQLPVLALLWAVVCGAVCWRALPRAGRRMALGLVAVLGAFLLLIMAPSLIGDLPEAWRYIQFPYRLLTYADLAAVGLVTLALVGLRRAGPRGRIGALALVGIAVFALALSIVQASQVRSWLPGRAFAHESWGVPPGSWYTGLQFADAAAPRVGATQPILRIPAGSGARRSYTVEYPAGPAGTVETNVRTWTYFVDVTGAEPVGVTRKGKMVLRLPASPNRPRRVTFEQSWGAGVSIGRWISVICAALAIVAAATCAFVRLDEMWRRRRGEARA